MGIRTSKGIKVILSDDEVKDLWDKGFGSGTIAIKLKVREYLVKKVLNKLGLKRSVEEARLVRPSNEDGYIR